MAEDPAPSPARALLQDALGSFGKVAAAVAGAGIFLYLIGVGVFWQRLSAADLQEQEVVAAIPRDQLAVLGAREALLSTIAGVVFAVFLYAYYRLWQRSRDATDRAGVRGFFVRFMRDRPALLATVVLAFALPLYLPMADWSSALFLVLFLANVYFGFDSAHRSLVGRLPSFRDSVRPWLRVALGLAIAVFLVSVSRQSQFPDPFPGAEIVLDDHTLAGQYLGSTSDTVIIGQPPGTAARCGATRRYESSSATTCVVARSAIKAFRLTRGDDPPPPGESILHRLGVLKLDCLPPVCRYDGKTFTLLQAFVTDR